MSNFKDIWTNKRVVLVGPSGHLAGKGIGKLIDSYDVVCRVNDVLPCFIEDYGSRTDVIFYNCSTNSLNWFRQKFEDNKEIIKNIKYVVCPVIKSDHQWQGNVTKNFETINKYNLNFHWIGEKKYNEYSDMVKVEPNAGINSILMILEYPIKELFITGFSFYVQGNTYERCYYKDHVLNEHKESNFNPWEGHQQPPQIKFFREYVLNRYAGTVKIDSYLDEILKLNYFNVEKI